MNNNFKKLMVAGLACLALCGTTFAAPHGGNHGRAPAKPAVHHKAPAHHEAPKPAHYAHHTHHRAPAHHHHPAPPPPVVVHHYPAPPPPPPPPPATVVVHEEPGLGTLLGAVVGGLLGAAL